jgi:hypothetical protein
MRSDEPGYEKNYKELLTLLGTATERRIEVEGYLPLVIEKLEGMPIISMCHYGEQNLDPMRDPEVCFLLKEESAKPVYYRNDYVGVEHATVAGYFGDVPVEPQRQHGLANFSRWWLARLNELGFFARAKELNEEALLKSKDGATTQARVMPENPHNEEIMMAATSRFEELCSFPSGRFTVSASGRFNEQSQTYTYAANILCDERKLFDTQLKHELTGLSRTASKEGEVWLNRWLLASGVPNCVATDQDLQDFRCAVRTSEKLIGQFAQHGHEEVLKNPNLLQEMRLEAKPEATQEIQTVTRQR